MTHGENEVMPSLLSWFRRRLFTKDEIRAVLKPLVSGEQTLAQVTWFGRSRSVVVKTTTTESGSRKLEAPLSPEQFDPWNSNESADLPAKTHQLTVCPTCDGEKLVDCGVCRASGYVSCPNCSGTGHVWSTKSKRSVNCSYCRGKGQKKCSCRNGRVTCSTCEGKGKVERWLQIEENPFKQNLDASKGGEGLILPWSVSGSKTLDERYGSTTPVAVWSGPSPEGAPTEMAEWFAVNELKPVVNSREDRLESVNIELFRRPVWTVDFNLLGQTSRLAVVGEKCQIVPQPGADKPIIYRLMILGFISLLVFLLGRHLLDRYIAQYPAYYSQTMNAQILSLGSWLLPLLVWPLGGYVIARVWRRSLWLRYGVPLLICLLTITIAMYTGDPTVAEARQAFTVKDTPAASTLTAALIDLNLERSSAEKLSDEILVQGALETSELDPLLPFLTKKFYDAGKQKEVEDHVVVTALKVADDLYKKNQYQAAEMELLRLPARLQNDLVKRQRIRSRFPRLYTLVESTDTGEIENEKKLLMELGATEEELVPVQNAADAVAVARITVIATEAEDRELETEERLQRYKELRRLLSFAELIGTGQVALPISEEQLSVKIDQLSTQLDKEKALEEARISREQEREERKRIKAEQQEARRQQQAEKQERARERRKSERKSGGGNRAVCCDGTYSPTCGCGGGRGCCSHHGGVCGCG